jgi:hypothetical protein
MDNFQDIAGQRGSSSLEISPASEPVSAVSASVATGRRGTVAGVRIAPVAGAPSPSDKAHARDDSGPAGVATPMVSVVPTPTHRKKARPFHRACKTCTSPAVSEIEALCSQGVAATIVGKRFNITGDSVRRHWSSHVDGDRKARLIGRNVFAEPVEVADQFEVLKENERSRWLARLSIQRSDLTALTKHADARVAVMAHRTLLVLSDQVGRHLDQLGTGPSNVTNNLNIVASQGDLAQLRSIVDEALRPYPAARSALLMALAQRAAIEKASQ